MKEIRNIYKNLKTNAVKRNRRYKKWKDTSYSWARIIIIIQITIHLLLPQLLDTFLNSRGGFSVGDGDLTLQTALNPVTRI